MAERKFIDWESIEPLYRAGNLSNCEICKQYAEDHKHSQTYRTTVTEGAIRHRAKIKGWQRNIADKVQKQVKENVLRSQLRITNQDVEGASDQEIIEKVAEAGANVIIRHQKEIAALLEHEERLLEELANNAKKLYVANFQGEIITKELSLTVKEKAATLKDLTTVRAQRVALERQAHNLDTDDKGTGEEEFRLKPLWKQEQNGS